MYSTEMIPTDIGVSSLVSVGGTFPRGHGNYISTYDDETGMHYSIVNLSAEDLRDAIAAGLVGSTIKAEVYYHNNSPVAFIIDERLPTKCLEPEWWYGVRYSQKVEILRRKYSVPEGVCLCEFDSTIETSKNVRSFSYDEVPEHVVTHSECHECGKVFRNVKPKKIEGIFTWKISKKP